MAEMKIKCNIDEWFSSLMEKEVKKVELNSSVIVIEDSDSEMATESTVVEVLPRTKSPLICLLSDDEEEVKENRGRTPLKQLDNTDKNELSNSSIYTPMACSTPTPGSPDHCPDITYFIINDISQVSEEVIDVDSSWSTDCDKNIVLEESSQSIKEITLLQHVIVPSKVQSNEAGTSVSKLPMQSSIKRKSTETEGKTKRLKTAAINNNSSGPLTEVQQNKNAGVESSLDTIQKITGHYRTVVGAKKKEKKMILGPVILLTELFNSVLSSKHVNNLLENERKIIKKFLKMDTKYQYLCLKLIMITWKKEWYNVYKFCQRIHLDMEDTDIYEMFTVLSDNGFIDTDYLDSPDVLHLLHCLNISDLRAMCHKFKIREVPERKDMVLNIIEYCESQPTSTNYKTAKDFVIDEIIYNMGICMRVNEEFQNAFCTTFVLGTFTNSKFVTMADYFYCMLLHKLVFPHYPIDDYTIFNSRNDFVSYAKAKKYRDEIEISNNLECLKICKTVFEELKDLNNSRTDDELFKNAPHLRRYTAKAVYVSTLSFGVKTLFTKFPYDVKEWLEYMIEQINYPHLTGFWYFHLIWLYIKYLKPFDYDHASNLLVEVLEMKRHHLSDIQLDQLRKCGEQLMDSRKYKIHPFRRYNIVQLLPKRIEADIFPEITVNAKTIQSNDIGQKYCDVLRDNDGIKNILKVEDMALEHYLELGYTGGEHCEGSFVMATFTLFFFDIIYSSKRIIPGAFVSKMQREPLDMNTEYFYQNRKEEIDSRLKEIEYEWSDGKVISFLTDSYDKHSHEFTLCYVGHIIRDREFLKVLVECIGRVVLAKIFQRLVTNFKEYRSGLPDLLVWNKDTKECKFVAVKGENYRLSIGQTLWLNYLHSVGASIEVCHVHCKC